MADQRIPELAPVTVPALTDRTNVRQAGDTRDKYETLAQVLSLVPPPTEVNDLSAAVTWVNVPDLNITQSSVVQHEAALTITESQISDLGAYITADVVYTATFDDDAAFNISANAAGFGGINAINLGYATGAIVTGQDEAVILVNIDESLATGGEIAALEALATSGAADGIAGTFVGGGIGPVKQLSGVFIDATTILDNAADVTVALSSGGAGNIGIFDADNDTVTVGLASQYQEIQFILDTPASNPGIDPLFEYSTGVGTWAAFTPTDGTNQMRQSGVVAWLLTDIPSWAVGTGSEFLIRITRQRNTLGTTPIADLVQVLSANLYEWDKDGNITLSTVRSVAAASGGLEVDNQSTGAGFERVLTTSDLGGGASFPEFQFFADQMQNPVTADWAVNALAPAAADNINSGLTIRAFDDTVEEGIGFIVKVPSTATNIVFDYVSRARSPQPIPNNVGVKVYQRGIGDDVVVDSWSAGNQLTDIALPNNTNFQYDSETVALATLGATAGEVTQFELTRVTPTGGNNQVGDWHLLELKVSFT